MKNIIEKEYIFLKETLIQSILSDLITISTLCFAIWFSHKQGNSNFWNIVCFLFLGIFVCYSLERSGKKRKVFKSRKEIYEYLQKEE